MNHVEEVGPFTSQMHAVNFSKCMFLQVVEVPVPVTQEEVVHVPVVKTATRQRQAGSSHTAEIH